jgi:stage II sporulation protein AB (anti-sigma F factor)
MLDTEHGFSHSYPAVAESVPSVRSALTDYVVEAGVGEDQLEAIRLAASEAVTNGVLHAYDGPDGTIHVNASHVGEEFWLLIADDGTGLRPRGPHSGLGLGLALIAQLADDFQILSRSTGGTELRMHADAAPRQLRGSASSAAIPA